MTSASHLPSHHASHRLNTYEIPWQMHRPHRPQAILTAAIFQADTGLELRIGFSDTNLIHSELSRKSDAPLLARAEDLRVVLLGQGWVELVAPATTQ